MNGFTKLKITVSGSSGLTTDTLPSSSKRVLYPAWLMRNTYACPADDLSLTMMFSLTVLDWITYWRSVLGRMS